MIDPGIRTPLVDSFRRGEVAKDVRLQAARGEMAPRGVEQLAVLLILTDDADAEIRETAAGTLKSIPRSALRARGTLCENRRAWGDAPMARGAGGHACRFGTRY